MSGEASVFFARRTTATRTGTHTSTTRPATTSDDSLQRACREFGESASRPAEFLGEPGVVAAVHGQAIMGMVTHITQGERFDGPRGGIVVPDDGIEGIIKPDAI